MMEKLGAEIKSGMTGVKSAVEEPMTPEINISPAQQALRELAEDAYKTAVAAQKIAIGLEASKREASGGAGFDLLRKNTKAWREEAERATQSWKKFENMSANIHFTGTGSTKEPISKKIEQVKTWFAGMSSDMSHSAANIAMQDDEGTPISRAFERTQANFQKMVAGMKGGLRFGLPAPVRTEIQASAPGSSGLDLKDMGKMELMVGGKKAPIIGKTDVLKWIKETVKGEQRTGES